MVRLFGRSLRAGEEVGGEGGGAGGRRAAAARAPAAAAAAAALRARRGEEGEGGREEGGGAPAAGANKGRGERWGWDSAGRAAGGGPTTMPRVVPDQRSKFENEEFFRKLSRECEVRRRRCPPSSPRTATTHIPPQPPPPSRPPRGKFPRAAEGPAEPRASPQPRRGSRARRRGEAQSVHSAAPLSPGLAPPDCAPCSPQIKYTGFRDRPHEERQARFQNACRDGRSEIVSGAAFPSRPAGTGPGRPPAPVSRRGSGPRPSAALPASQPPFLFSFLK